MPSSAPATRSKALEGPIARGTCAVCRVEGTARVLVQDLEFRQYLCRAHAREMPVERAIYEQAGRRGEAAHPTPEAWSKLLEDASATSIRVYRDRHKAARPEHPG